MRKFLTFFLAGQFLFSLSLKAEIGTYEEREKFAVESLKSLFKKFNKVSQKLTNEGKGMNPLYEYEEGSMELRHADSFLQDYIGDVIFPGEMELEEMKFSYVDKNTGRTLKGVLSLYTASGSFAKRMIPDVEFFQRMPQWHENYDLQTGRVPRASRFNPYPLIWVQAKTIADIKVLNE